MGQEPRRILVGRRLGGIGDILMMTPAVRQLRVLNPEAYIVFGCPPEYFELLEGAWFVDSVVDIRRVIPGEYDLFVDLTTACIGYEQLDLKPHLNRIDLFGRALGLAQIDNPLPHYTVSDRETAWAEDFLHRNSLEPPLVFIQGTAHCEKRSWPLPYALALADSLERLGFSVLVNEPIGMEERKIVSTHDLTVRQVASLIGRSSVLVGPDSGLMHIAGALQVPAIVLFGATPSEARTNHYPGHYAMSVRGFSCSPCWYKECIHEESCMWTLTPDSVLPKVLSLVEALS